MKRIFRHVFFAVLITICGLAFVSCNGSSDAGGKKEDNPVDITGEWELSKVETKSVKIGDESVTVYVKFDGGTFTLYQVLGKGRPRKYTGTYTLSDNLLSGKYSDGSNWGSSYTVSASGSTLNLAQTGGKEIDSFRKTTIPQDIVDKAI